MAFEATCMRMHSRGRFIGGTASQQLRAIGDNIGICVTVGITIEVAIGIIDN